MADPHQPPSSSSSPPSSTTTTTALPSHPPVNLVALIQQGAWEKAQSLKDDTGGFRRHSSSRVNGLRALGWRQRFHHSNHYQVDMFHGEVQLSIRQIKMGEMTGLGTGANVWAAAHVLVKYLEKKYGRNGLQDKRVVDLGCGTGLTGLACLALGAKEVLLTDQQQILFLAQENTQRCQGVLPIDRVHVMEYNWGGDDISLHPPLDVIIVSDCLLPKLFPIEPLVEALDRLSGPHTTIIVSYEHRHYPLFDPREYFTKLLEGRGLQRERVADHELDQDYWAEDIEVWEIRRRRRDGTSTSSGGGGEGKEG